MRTIRNQRSGTRRSGPEQALRSVLCAHTICARPNRRRCDAEYRAASPATLQTDVLQSSDDIEVALISTVDCPVVAMTL